MFVEFHSHLMKCIVFWVRYMFNHPMPKYTSTLCITQCYEDHCLHVMKMCRKRISNFQMFSGMLVCRCAIAAIFWVVHNKFVCALCVLFLFHCPYSIRSAKQCSAIYSNVLKWLFEMAVCAGLLSLSHVSLLSLRRPLFSSAIMRLVFVEFGY